MFQQQFKTMVEQNYWMSHNKATYLITTFNELAIYIIHDTPTETMYKDVTEVLEDRFGDHHLHAAFHSQLKRRTQLIKKSLQEFATAIDHLAHHAHTELPKHIISKEATHMFADGLRQQDVR
jgi:hypothetical protein